MKGLLLRCNWKCYDVYCVRKRFRKGIALISESIKWHLGDVEANAHLSKYTVSDNLEQSVYRLLAFISESENVSKQEISSAVEDIADETNAETAVFLYSLAISLDKRNSLLIKILKNVYTCRDILGVDKVYGVYHQICHITFAFGELDSEEVLEEKNKIYEWCVNQYMQEVCDYITEIHKEERYVDKVVVLVQQMIDYHHAPSRVALDRCKCLIDAGYKVLLINTAELLAGVNGIKFVSKVEPSYCEAFIDKDYLEWKDTKIPFFQCEQNMPNIATITQLLKAISTMKPFFALSIASGTIFEGLMSKLIPVLGIPMSAGLTISGANCQIHIGPLDNKHYRIQEILGMSDCQIIHIDQSGFSIIDQKEKHSRYEIGIDDDSFIMAVVGGRLNNELNKSFWEMFRKALLQVPYLKLLIIGDYNFEIDVKGLENNVVLMGYVDDFLSWIEICDLYVNPHRIGGGTSSVEALSKGVPVLTENYGDVATNVGEAFCVRDYSEYPMIIKKYYDNKEFYERQSNLAKERAEQLLKHDTDFLKILEEFKRRCI